MDAIIVEFRRENTALLILVGQLKRRCRDGKHFGMIGEQVGIERLYMGRGDAHFDRHDIGQERDEETTLHIGQEPIRPRRERGVKAAAQHGCIDINALYFHRSYDTPYRHKPPSEHA
jgi:hypothetical protein